MQGQQRRVVVKVKPVHNSGTLPIICEAITSVSIGGICSRSKLQKPLDTYQEEDLTLLREKWSEALMKRREYLDSQIQKIINKKGENKIINLKVIKMPLDVMFFKFCFFLYTNCPNQFCIIIQNR